MFGYDVSVEVFPCKDAVFKCHVAMNAVFLRNGYGTGVQIQITAFIAASGNVRMTVDEDVTVAELGRIVFAEVMTVRQINAVTVKVKDRVIGEDREIQNHLIDFGVAVAADAEQTVGDIIEKCNDFFGGITVGKIVARTVI